MAKGDVWDCVVIGGGVTGTATLYTLAKYTPLKRLLLVEKYPGLGWVASHKDNNSQTLHVGDIETNYSKDKAARVKRDADLTRGYLERHREEALWSVKPKMVLAVGKTECQTLRERYTWVKDLYPGAKLITRREIAKIEPKLIEGRSQRQEILAMRAADGFVVDYGRLSESFVRHAEHLPGKTVETVLQGRTKRITRRGNGFVVETCDGTFRARSVVVAAGGESLLFAHRMGIAKDWILLPVAGSFYRARKVLHGKVYMMQNPKLPFAAIHGDPDVHDGRETRFGPTAKVIPMLERYHYRSFWDFLRLFRFRLDAIIALFKILGDPTNARFVARNLLYDLPIIGHWAYLQECRKIVPSLRYKDIHYARHVGGIRPQVVDVKRRVMEFGEAKAFGDGIVFDITPSPGATVCLANASKNAAHIAKHLRVRYDEAAFLADHKPQSALCPRSV
jgi:malate dehydrogenase (quinone)